MGRAMIYGHDKTIHSTKEVNIEIGPDGRVVSVWFRCLLLPFDVTNVNAARADEMEKAYQKNPPRAVIAIEVEEASERREKPNES